MPFLLNGSSAVHLGTEVRYGMVGKVENRVQFPGKSQFIDAEVSWLSWKGSGHQVGVKG
jgi:hypothetical protein